MWKIIVPVAIFIILGIIAFLQWFWGKDGPEWDEELEMRSTGKPYTQEEIEQIKQQGIANDRRIKDEATR